MYIFDNYYENDVNGYQWWKDVLIDQRDKMKNCLDTIKTVNIIIYMPEEGKLDWDNKTSLPLKIGDTIQSKTKLVDYNTSLPPKFELKGYNVADNHKIFYLDSGIDYRGADMKYELNGCKILWTFDENGKAHSSTTSFNGITHFQKDTRVVLEADGCSSAATAFIEVADGKQSTVTI